MPRILRRISPSTSASDSLAIAPCRTKKTPSMPSVASESATARNSAQKRSTTASATVGPGIARRSRAGSSSQSRKVATSSTPAMGEASLAPRICSPRLISKSPRSVLPPTKAFVWWKSPARRTLLFTPNATGKRFDCSGQSPITARSTQHRPKLPKPAQSDGSGDEQGEYRGGGYECCESRAPSQHTGDLLDLGPVDNG